MSFFVLEETLQLILRETKLQIVDERGELATGSQYFKHFFVA